MPLGVLAAATSGKPPVQPPPGAPLLDLDSRYLLPGAVSLWANRGTLGSAGNVVQAVSAARPTLVGGGPGLRGAPYVTFDGADYLATPAVSFPAPAQPNVVAIVGKVTAPGTITNQYFIDGDAVSRRHGIFAALATSGVSAFAGAQLDGPVMGANTWHMMIVRFDGVASAVYLDEAAPVIGDAGVQEPRGFTIGRSWTSTGNLVGAVARVLFYDPSQDVDELKAYLVGTYGSFPQ